METAPLKNFATGARPALIREVTARIAGVLAPGSSERVEQPKAVAALEEAVSAAGDGDQGRAAVADKVAYTWFNRIVALRFMDANGYTAIGVVSPQAGAEVGQPEILAEAKRGVIDVEVVNEPTRKTVNALLDGTLSSNDPQGEAYALLLAAYCRYWNKTMPFMFEREGDFTELLIPANLLADDSVLNRSVMVLTEGVCKDVEVIGWLYQFYISERKDEVFAGFKKNKKAGADEIPAATQLFTPHWIVRYLVENSIGRLWLLNRPSSGLASQMDYYIAPVDEETDFLKIAKPEELKVIDPACGSGHMLTYAFDLLYAIYEEEGYGPAEIPGLILTHNLYGTEIDPRAGALAAFALTMKARSKQRTFFNKQVKPNICVIEPISFSPDELDFLITKDGDKHAEEEFWNQFAEADTFGALIQPDPDLVPRLLQHLETLDAGGDLYRADSIERARIAIRQAEYLCPGYAVVVANPPYMGSKQMNGLLSQFMKDKYPDAKQDLYGAFVVRGIELAHDDGLLATVIGDTWMSIKSFEVLRIRLLQGHAFDSFVHMRDVSNHPDIFGANAAFVLSMVGNRSQHAPFIRLTPLGSDRKEENLRIALAKRSPDAGFHLASGADFAAIPGSPIVYWLSENMRAAFVQPEDALLPVAFREGLSSSNNDRFVREWFEVSADKTNFHAVSRSDAKESHKSWFPFDSGGGFRRWWGNHEVVINWRNDGQEIFAERPRSTVRNPDKYFHEHLTISKISSGASSFRLFPNGFVIASVSKCAFAEPMELRWISGVLNSNVTHAMLAAKSPTLSFLASDLESIPLRSGEVDLLAERVEQLTECSQTDWDSAETSWDFAQNPLVAIAGNE